jgi:amino acid permease
MQHRGQIRWRAVLLLIGTIVGAGIFGVPAMIGAWGIPVSTVAFAAITLVILAAHLLYAEAILKNGRTARLESHAVHWLGKPMGAAAGGIQALQIFGSNLAYLIIGGEFLAVLMRAIGINVPTIWWQLAFWLFGAAIVCYGLALVTRAEVYLTWALIVMLVVLIIAFAWNIRVEDVSALAFSLPERFTFEPYGVILFALMGVTTIPEAVDIVGRRRDDVFKVIIRATVASAFITYVFGVFGWLATSGLIGRNPSDLVAFVPPVVAIAFPLAGFLAIITSYIATALDLRNMFHLDYHFSDALAWIVSLGVPLALLFLTPRDFLGTIGLVGAVFGTLLAAIVSIMGYVALSRDRIRHEPLASVLWRRVAPIVTMIVLLAGGVMWVFAS